MSTWFEDSINVTLVNHHLHTSILFLLLSILLIPSVLLGHSDWHPSIPRAYHKCFYREVRKEKSHSPKLIQGSISLLEYTDGYHLLLTVTLITSLERNIMERRRSQGNRLGCWEQGKTTVLLIQTTHLSFQNKMILNKKCKQQSVPSKTRLS